MSARKLAKPLLALILTLMLSGFALNKCVHAQSPTPNPQNAGSRPVGTVKAISGNSVPLATDAGA